MDRLNRKLRAVGIVVEGAQVKTRPSGGPPCFRLGGASYKDWLSQASVEFDTLPYRLSMPAEPNYCRDCTPAFKAQMLKINACIFPSVTFEEVDELGERALVGMSRNPDVAPSYFEWYARLADLKFVKSRRTK